MQSSWKNAGLLLLVGLGLYQTGGVAHAAEINPLASSDILDGFRVTASTGKREYIIGDPIILNVVVKNTTAKPLVLFKWFGTPKLKYPLGFFFDVTNDIRAPLNHTLYGWHLFPPLAGGVISYRHRVDVAAEQPVTNPRVVLPGHEVHYSLRVDTIYDLTYATSYTFVVKRPVTNPDGSNPGMANSNPVTFTVKEPVIDYGTDVPSGTPPAPGANDSDGH